MLPLSLSSLPVVHIDARLFEPAPTPAPAPVRLVERYPEHNAIIAEVSNDTSDLYYSSGICANLRDASGSIVEVGRGALFPTLLKPGETRQVPIYFNSLPEGTIEFHIRGGPVTTETARTALLDPSMLKITASRVVQTDHGRELQGVGEIHNNLQTDLAATQFQLRLKSSPTVLGGGLVGAGEILQGEDTAFSFAIPLGDTDKPEVEVVGIEGMPLHLDLPPLFVKQVTRERVSPDTWKVSATIVNPSASEGLQVNLLYFNLRGSDRQIVGTSGLVEQWIEPGGSATFSQTVTALAPVASAEIIANGHAGSQVTPPS